MYLYTKSQKITPDFDLETIKNLNKFDN